MATSKISNIRSPKQYDLPTIPDTTTGRTTTVSLPHISRRGYIMITSAYIYSLFVVDGSTMNIYSLRNNDQNPEPTVSGSDYTFTFDFSDTGVRNVKPFIIGTCND